MKRLQDKVAVFIGGGSSVGSVACQKFLEEGANVVLVDIDEKYFERTKDLRAEYGESRVLTFIGACTSQADMDAAMKFVIEKFGKIDIVLNIACFHGSGWIDVILPEQWNLAHCSCVPASGSADWKKAGTYELHRAGVYDPDGGGISFAGAV